MSLHSHNNFHPSKYAIACYEHVWLTKHLALLQIEYKKAILTLTRYLFIHAIIEVLKILWGGYLQSLNAKCFVQLESKLGVKLITRVDA